MYSAMVDTKRSTDERRIKNVTILNGLNLLNFKAQKNVNEARAMYKVRLGNRVPEIK